MDAALDPRRSLGSMSASPRVRSEQDAEDEEKARLKALKTVSIMQDGQGSGGPTNMSDALNSGIFGQIARSPWFDNATFFVIALNAVWISVDLDLNTEALLVNAPIHFQVAEHFFCTFFLVEWCVRILACRNKRLALRDTWFLFDTALLALMVFETWVISILVSVANVTLVGNNLTTLTLLRLLRLLRLTRITRLMRMMPEMMIMVRGMVSATRSVCITLFLLMIMIYIFAILLVQMTRETTSGEDYFPFVYIAMYGLLIEAILPDQGSMVRTLGDDRWYFGLTFCIFVIFSTFTMINMLIGILCEVACRVSAAEKEKMEIDILKSKLQDLIETELDTNGDHLISKLEFLGITAKPDCVKALRQVGVDAKDLVFHADFIFDTVDDNGELLMRRLDFPSFIQVILKFRDSNAATVKDITFLKKFFQDNLLNVERKVRAGYRWHTQSLMSQQDSMDKLQPKADDAKLREEEEAADLEQPKFVMPPPDLLNPIDLQALQQLPAEVSELKDRMARLEGLMEQVLQGQLQMQAVVKERLPAPASKQESYAKRRSEQLRAASLDGSKRNAKRRDIPLNCCAPPGVLWPPGCAGPAQQGTADQVAMAS